MLNNQRDIGANKLFDRQKIDGLSAQRQQSNVVIAQLEIPLDTALYGLQRAKASGKTTILNPAPARDLRGLDLSAIDYLTPNETEARMGLGLAPDDARRATLHRYRLMSYGASVLKTGMFRPSNKHKRRYEA